MNSKTKRITVIGMLCAITYVTMVVGRIPIILFLKYDPSDVIVTLGGFIWGPMTSCIVSVIVAKPYCKGHRYIKTVIGYGYKFNSE